MYAGKHFQLETEGQELFDELDHSDKGFIQLSSHVGNYELAGYSLVPKQKSFNALIFGGETAQVMNGRRSMFLGKRIHMIPLSEDMSHVFLINKALSEGNIVSIPGDRVFGASRVVTCSFMDGKAGFPSGPFSMAVQRSGTNKQDKIKELAQAFANELENMIRMYPTQWFNYFDFWEE